MLFVFALYGCDTVDVLNPEIANENELPLSFSSVNGDVPDYLKHYEQTVIDGNTIRFTGRSVSKNAEGEIIHTTLSYSITNDGTTSQANKFFLETPSCAGNLHSQNPTQSSSVEPDGVSWSNAIPNEGSRSYSITFSGDIPLGIITTSLTRGSTITNRKIIGPCAGVYTISGSAYFDANGDGFKQAAETGVANVVISIKEKGNSENSWTTNTSANGDYSFRVLSGTYIVSSPDQLFGGTYTASTENSIEVDVKDQDVGNKHFGYLMDTEKAIRDLTEGDLSNSLTTEPTRFWVQQIRHAGRNNSILTMDELNSLLTDIQNYLPPDPYGLSGSTNKQRTALNILTNPIRTEFDAFLQQLLTAELNIEFGLGTGNPDYDEALRIYSRSLVACLIDTTCTFGSSSLSMQANSVIFGASESVSGTLSNTSLSDGTTVLSAFNGTGGIGTR